jgi:hypothetical protein
MGARIFALGAVMAVVGCTSADKAPVEEDFGDLAGLMADGKADHNTGLIVGSLSYGQTSALVQYANPPRYRIFKFAADAGDEIDVRVTSTNGDAMVWVLDDSFAVLGFNDDAAPSTLNARVKLVVPPHPSRTHYIFFRDYDSLPASFRVRLDGIAAGCAVDADCAMVEAGCCSVGNWTAVPKDEVAAFEASKNCGPNPICPLVPIVDRGEQAICDVDVRQCEVALPEEIACGGRSLNPHRCPDGWRCVGEQLAWDAPGSCARTCSATRPCQGGLSCLDAPGDGCTGPGCPRVCL